MSTTTELRTKQKIKAFEESMKGDHVLVHLDARTPGVSVPTNLAGNHSLTLKISYLFQGKTDHNEESVSTYLKFGSEYFNCVIPWKAVWGLTSGDGKQFVWPEDLPQELVAEFTKAKFKQLGKKLFKKSKQQPDEQIDMPITEPSSLPIPEPLKPKPGSPEERRKQLKLIK